MAISSSSTPTSEAGGMDFGSVFMATCSPQHSAAPSWGFMRITRSRLPGMGLNAYFTFGVVKGMGLSWQVLLEQSSSPPHLSRAVGLKVREWIVNAIPLSMKLGIAAARACFSASFALKNADIIVAHPATLVSLGECKDIARALAAIGFALIVALSARKITGAIIHLDPRSHGGGDRAWADRIQRHRLGAAFIAPTFLQMDLAGAVNVGSSGPSSSYFSSSISSTTLAR